MDENEIIDNGVVETEQAQPVSESAAVEVQEESEAIDLDNIGDKEIAELSDEDLEKALKKDLVTEAKEKALKETPKPTVQPEDPIQKQIVNQKYVIDKLGNEVGQLRSTFTNWQQNPQAAIDYYMGLKQAAQPTPELSPEDKFAALTDDPEKYVESVLEKKQAAAVRAQIESNRAIAEKQKTLNELAPGWDKNAPEIIQAMREDGLDPDSITNMVDNMWAYPVDVWYHYNKRAMAIKVVAEKDRRIAELEKKPGGILKNINAAVRNNQEKRIAGNVPDTESEIPDMSEMDIKKLSDKQLEEMMNKINKKGR